MELKIIFKATRRMLFDGILFRWKIGERYANFCNKKLVYLFFMLIGLMFSFNAQSQIIIEQGTVKANFGIDADVKSDITTFTAPVWATPQNTDDWFQLDGGTGKGVIDIISASALSQIQSLQVNPNASAELRMAYPYFTLVDGRYWIDAVYLRDQQTSGNYKDSNVFAGQSNKNFDNPNTWSIGLGDVPQKNDIIDVYGHLRRDGTNILTDPEWGFVGLSTRNDNGDSYIDIEYFRKKIEVGGNGIVSPGTDGGRTAWLFSNTGMTTQLGDIIISLNFSNGGVGIEGKIYVWMRLDDKNTAYFDNFNTLLDRPFRFVKVGNSYDTHDGGNGAGGFGYARIELKNIGDPTAIFSAVNIGSSVDAPSWGTINSSGNIATVYSPIIFYEFGFNLTELGFDSSATQVGCVSPFGSVIVKTRSSDSFTAELKDLAGPIELGADLEVDVTITGDTEIDCTESSSILTATATPATNNFAYQWYFNGNPIFGATNSTLEVSVAGNYSVQATIVLGTIQGCTASDDVDVTVTPPVPININCPENNQMPSCSTQASINSAFETWYNSFTASGGTNLEIQKTITDQQGNTVVLGNPIVGPDACGGVYTVLLQASDDCNQAAQCSGTFTVVGDTTVPEIVDVPDYKLTGCNTPWPTNLTTDWTDNCAAGGIGILSDGGVDQPDSADGCTQYRLYTFTITDDCGNSDTETTLVSRDYDMTDPEIVDVPDYKLTGCNTPWPTNLTTDWTDNCAAGGIGILSDGGVDQPDSADGCTQYRLYTFTITDDCGNSDTETTLVSRDYDMTDPEIVDVPDYKLTGCNTPWPTNLTTDWTDNCAAGGIGILSDGGVDQPDSADGCTQYRLYTFTITDDCGNSDTETTLVSRDYDMTDPEIVDVPDYKLTGCNTPWPVNLTTDWTDNCAAGGIGILSDGGVDQPDSADGCTQYRLYTFTITDDCGNSDTETTLVSRDYDMTNPEIVDIPDYKLIGCNTPWPVNLTTDWTDNCAAGGIGILSDGGVDQSDRADGCTQYRLYTFTITDDCGNSDTETTLVSRDYDMTDPEIVDVPDYKLTGCNTPWPVNLTTDWTDNCAAGGIGILSDGGVDQPDSADGCTQYRLYTFTITDDCGNSDTETTLVSRDFDETPPIINCPSDIEVFDCEGVPYIDIPTATDNCDQDVVVTAVRSDGLELNDTFPIGVVVTITLTAEDDCENEANCSFTVLVNSCDAPHCTYTQGFYGNVNGVACLPDGGSTMAQDIMVAALTNVGGEYNFGSMITGNYFLLKLTDINANPVPIQNNIFIMMPGGGTPRSLIDFATYDIYATWADNDPLNSSGRKMGRINNNLLSQTITLFFNLQMDNSLGSYELTNTFATVDVECGTDTPIPDTTQIFNIPQSVIDYLTLNGGATVSNLFTLANKALGDENIGGLSPSNINAAVDAINRGFDRCRMQVPVPVEEPTDLSSALLKADFMVFPVPFKDYFTIRYQFRYQSDVEIQVFDARGLLLMTAQDKDATYGKEFRVNTAFNMVGRDAFYYVKVISKTGVSIKKIVAMSN